MVLNSILKQYVNSRSKCTTVESQANTMIGKWIAEFLFEGEKQSRYKQYRKLKSSGKAHEWQQLISKKLFNEINFSRVSGRALRIMVKSKFLANQNLLAGYEKWLGKQETVKFTGFPHELFMNFAHSTTQIQKMTIDKQFMELVKNLNQESPLIVVRDTSSSMNAAANGIKMSAGDVAKALALYFSYGLKGKFQDAWIEFDNAASMKVWKGENPTDRWINDRSNYIGGTNFQSVIDLFISLKKSGVPVEDFPKGIICISDGEFNPSSLNTTNVDAARQRLAKAFGQDYANEFKIILWNIPNLHYGNSTKAKYETVATATNTFYFSGYDGAVVSFLMGNESAIKTKTEISPSNAAELFETAMNQELLQKIEI